MSREELKEILTKVINRLSDDVEEAPGPACIFSDTQHCDVSTDYGIGEEA